jgi:hypothetical protein
MGIDIIIHAERFENGFWNAVSTGIENISFGDRIIDSWVESKPLFVNRDRDLSKILGSIPPLSGDVNHGRRGFPQDISNEVLRALTIWPEDNDSIRTDLVNQAIKFSSGWLLLEELMKFDWNSKMMLWHGKVEARYADLFGDGQQLFPNECPIEGLIQFKKEKACQTFWSFRKKQMLQPEYITVSWIEPYDGNDYHEKIEPIVENILPKLKTFGDPKNVRIIYWLLT